jgi:hypothetical protein
MKPSLPRPNHLILSDARPNLLPDGITPVELLRAGSLRALVSFACYYSARKIWPTSLPLLPSQRPGAKLPPVDPDFNDAFFRSFSCFSTAQEVGNEMLSILIDAEMIAVNARDVVSAAIVGTTENSAAALSAKTNADSACGHANGVTLSVCEAISTWIDPNQDYFLIMTPQNRQDALAAGLSFLSRIQNGPLSSILSSSTSSSSLSTNNIRLSPLEATAREEANSQQGNGQDREMKYSNFSATWPVLDEAIKLLSLRLRGSLQLIDALSAIVGVPNIIPQTIQDSLSRKPTTLLAAREVQKCLGFGQEALLASFTADIAAAATTATAIKNSTPSTVTVTNSNSTIKKPVELPPTLAGPLWTYPPAAIAEQWTLLDHAAFCAIPLKELLDCGWDKARFEHSADMVRRYVDRFNAVSLWISAEVLGQPGDEERAAMITRIVQTAAHLRRLHNYCGVSACIMALRRPSVSRLSFSWELVPAPVTTKLTELSGIVQDKEQYRRYKEILRTATTLPTNSDTPAVPHMGAHTMELTAAEMNLPETVDLTRTTSAATPAAKGINMKRYRTLLSMVAPLLSLQSRCYLQSNVIAARNAPLLGAMHSAQRPFYVVVDEDREAMVAKLEARSLRIEPVDAQRAAATAAAVTSSASTGAISAASPAGKALVASLAAARSSSATNSSTPQYQR